jgi:glyoxylase-like metal-dependent hydrolase (beta-lactamase superfamily II)
VAQPWMDQPADWTEPGAYPVAAGVHRIPLPLPFDALHAVNVYVIEAADGLILVDSGWAMPDTEKALVGALRELGHALSDVDRFVVTHAHWDHYTQALALRESHGIRVLIGRGERHSIEEFNHSGAAHPHQAELAQQVAALALQEHEIDVPFGPPDSWLDDGDRIAAHRHNLDVLATPGHTRGHVVVRDARHGLLFSGDHVLPHITPSIGLERCPEPRPLRSYLESLRLVRDLPDTLLLPAHGPVTPSVHTRVDELLAHHEARLEAAANQVRAGRETADAVARALRWTRRGRTFDELDLISQMLAVLEIDAHLDLLVEQGLLAAAEIDGVRRYATPAP